MLVLGALCLVSSQPPSSNTCLCTTVYYDFFSLYTSSVLTQNLIVYSMSWLTELAIGWITGPESNKSIFKIVQQIDSQTLLVQLYEMGHG